MNGAGDCPLPLAQQRRNQWLYATTFWMTYLSAPVTYFGSTQAALCEKLGASVTIANLPSTLYFAFSFVPLIWAWYSPYVRSLRRNAVLCFLTSGLTIAAVPVVLLLPVPPEAKWGMVVLQGAVGGIVMPAVGGVFMWEALARGVAQKRRGPTLSLTFGAGPILAVLGSIVQQGLLPQDPAKQWFPSLAFPENYAALYAVCAPCMFVNALLAWLLVVPLPEKENVRQSLYTGLVGGVVDFARDRVLRTAFLVGVLIYAGNLIPSNMTLYTRYAVGGEPSDWAGAASIWRFAAKAAAGFFLGLLLARTTPRTCLMATAAFFVLAQLWAINMTGPEYLAAFGLFGMGELIGVYVPNYILSASRKADVRRNMALATLVAVPSAVFGPIFGAVTDYFRHRGVPDVGFLASFGLCAAIMAAGMVIALVRLPARPVPADAAEPVGKPAG